MEREMQERVKSLKSMLYVIEVARKASKYYCCESIIRLDMGPDCIEKNGSWRCPACELRLAIKEHDQLHEEMFNSQHIEKKGA